MFIIVLMTVAALARHFSAPHRAAASAAGAAGRWLGRLHRPPTHTPSPTLQPPASVAHFFSGALIVQRADGAPLYCAALDAAAVGAAAANAGLGESRPEQAQRLHNRLAWRLHPWDVSAIPSLCAAGAPPAAAVAAGWTRLPRIAVGRHAALADLLMSPPLQRTAAAACITSLAGQPRLPAGTPATWYFYQALESFAPDSRLLCTDSAAHDEGVQFRDSGGAAYVAPRPRIDDPALVLLHRAA